MAPFDEAKAYEQGQEGGTFYAQDLVTAKEEKRRRANAPKVVPVEEQIWEDSPHGRVKHLATPRINPHIPDIEMLMQELPPDGRSGKHRHMAEEFMYILEGHGYSLHWDIEMDLEDRYVWKMPSTPQKFEWEAGDWVYIPVNTAHQHFNADGSRRARFLCASATIFKCLGWHDLEQLEPAPDPDRG